jgi:hypothetical protein
MTPLMPSPADLSREMEVVTKLSNVLLRHVVPLFKKEPGKRPTLVGSSLLLSSERLVFLVSAAHVLDEYRQLHFYIKPNKIRKLTGTLLRTKLPPSGNRIDDRVDIGVLRLEGVDLPPYVKVDKYALPVSALRPNALPREQKQYLLVGFPATRSKANPAAKELKSEPVSYRNIAAPTSKYADLQISPETHIVINLDTQHVLMPDGSISAFPQPAGLSGSPVWLLYDEHGTNDARQTPVVGIAIEYRKASQALVATDVEVVLKLIDASDSQD